MEKARKEIIREIAGLNSQEENVLFHSLAEDSLGELALFSAGKCLSHSPIFPFFTSEKDREECFWANRKEGIFSLGEGKFFAETLASEKKLIICGAGHVAIATIRLGKMLGFSVTCIEDRPLFAKEAEKAGAGRVICEDFAKALDSLEGDRDSYFVILTRGHVHDQICLRRILEKPKAYMGMMGSRRRVAMIKKNLLEEGFSQELLNSLHSPIGLKIGAESPEEIALSIMAEIVGVKSAGKNTIGYSEEILDAVEKEEKLVLATIIERKGSAPRSVGTKMSINPLGEITGTIGGGCAEAEVIQKSRELFLENAPEGLLYHVDLTDDAAAEEGMVCGGILEILLERY